MEKTVGVVSGGFDPLHIGHVRMFENARAYCDKLVVIINNDNWVKDKKGYVFMPQEERREIIKALECVDLVVFTTHSPHSVDKSVCHELLMLKPDIFFNGGDRKAGNIPEYNLCEEQEIAMMFNIGGDKIQHSSKLVENAKEK